MKLPLQITFHGLAPSGAIETAIRNRAQKLDHFHPEVIACRVAVGLVTRHKQQGRLYNVRLDLTVPGQELVVNRDAAEDVYVAIRDAFDDMRRKLEDQARLRRGDVKTHPVAEHGQIVRLYGQEGYGFIRTGDGREFYFSSENLTDVEFDRLGIGTQVQFIGELADDGPQAKRVSVGKHRFA